LKAATYSKAPRQTTSYTKTGVEPKKALFGVDVFFDWKQRNPTEFGKKLEQLNGGGVKLFAVSNRGTKVYPDGFAETFCTDHWRARFVGDGAVSHAQIVALLDRAGKADLDFIKIENLYTFDGQKGFVAEGE
jgi:isocitrate dehydrogenase